MVLSGESYAVGTAVTVKATQCDYIGKTFGPHSGHLDPYLNDCFRAAVENARTNRKLYASAVRGKLKVFGFRNLIYIQREETISVISGEMANLHDLHSVAVSPDGKSVAVLDQYKDNESQHRKQVLFFESSLNGNVVAFSVNSEMFVNSAQSLAFVSNDEVVISVGENSTESSLGKIISFKNTGDSRSPLVKSKPQPKNIVNSALYSRIRNPASAVAKGDEIIVLDANSGVQVINSKKDNAKVVWDLKPTDPLFKTLVDLNHLSYNPDKNILYIFDSLGNSAQLTY